MIPRAVVIRHFSFRQPEPRPPNPCQRSNGSQQSQAGRRRWAGRWLACAPGSASWRFGQILRRRAPKVSAPPRMTVSRLSRIWARPRCRV